MVKISTIFTERNCENYLLAKNYFYWRFPMFYSRKIYFIGDNEAVIGENQFLLATWKL